MSAELEPHEVGRLLSRFKSAHHLQDVGEKMLNKIIMNGIEFFYQVEEDWTTLQEGEQVTSSLGEVKVYEGKLLVVGNKPAEKAGDDTAKVDLVLAQTLDSDRLETIIHYRYDYSDSEREKQLKSLLRTQELKHRLLGAEMGCHTARHIAQLVGLTHGAIRAQEKQGKIFSVKHNEKKLYPFWQYAEDGSPYPGVSKVLDVYNPENKYELLAFFLSDHEAMQGTTPLQLLREGREDELEFLARIEANVMEEM